MATISSLSMVLYPSFSSDEPAYHLEGDPEARSFAEILVDVVAAEVVEPWGGGKWHLEIFRSAAPEPEEWNGEMLGSSGARGSRTEVGVALEAGRSIMPDRSVPDSQKELKICVCDMRSESR